MEWFQYISQIPPAFAKEGVKAISPLKKGVKGI